jgi:hypothetical protein
MAERDERNEPFQRLPAAYEPTPMQLLAAAHAKGASIEELRELMALQERFEANQARKAYVKAMAQFKSEPITVEKDRHVKIPHKNGGGITEYKHASLAAVVDAVVARMGKFGLAHNWDVKQADGHVTVTCAITHELGHTERVTITGPRDDSGSKNMLQQISSAVTYLQRYTLMALCGLASKEMDDDGRSTGSQSGPEVITTDQQTEIADLLKEGGHNAEKFLAWIGAPTIEQIPVKDYARAKTELQRKGKK